MSPLCQPWPLLSSVIFFVTPAHLESAEFSMCVSVLGSAVSCRQGLGPMTCCEPATCLAPCMGRCCRQCSGRARHPLACRSLQPHPGLAAAPQPAFPVTAGHWPSHPGRAWAGGHAYTGPGVLVQLRCIPSAQREDFEGLSGPGCVSLSPSKGAVWRSFWALCPLPAPHACCALLPAHCGVLLPTGLQGDRRAQRGWEDA